MDETKIIEELYLCAAECDACYKACLEEEEQEKLKRCIALDRECSDICALTAAILSRGSENTFRYLGLCAEICELCAAECEKHEHEHCQRCAHACHRCAELCMIQQQD